MRKQQREITNYQREIQNNTINDVKQISPSHVINTKNARGKSDLLLDKCCAEPSYKIPTNSQYFFSGWLIYNDCFPVHV